MLEENTGKPTEKFGRDSGQPESCTKYTLFYSRTVLVQTRSYNYELFNGEGKDSGQDKSFSF